jgi:hypothetical protein
MQPNKSSLLETIAGLMLMLMYYSGLAVHVFTIITAYQHSGFGAAFLSFGLPFLSEAYWTVYSMWVAGGLTLYALVIFAWVAWAGTALFLSYRLANKN